MQQANMALMLMGKMANPSTGETMRDMEAAQFFISQLEMLEVKTRGNLSKEEDMLLKQNLMSLRLAFVEGIESPLPTPTPSSEAKPAAPADKPAEKETAPTEADAASTKKFSKKY